VEQVSNRVIDGDEALEMSLRLEALHDPLSPPDWLMGILRPIVQALVGAMIDTRHDLPLCGGIRA
jgi:hypothetical protein